MDIDIIIKGGKELSEYYPKNYEAFKEKIGDLILDMFPGVGSVSLEPELTRQAQTVQKRREQDRENRLKQTLIEVFKESEFRDLIQRRIKETSRTTIEKMAEIPLEA